MSDDLSVHCVVFADWQPYPQAPWRARPWQVGVERTPEDRTMILDVARRAHIERLKQLRARKHCSPERLEKLRRKLVLAMREPWRPVL